MKLVLNVTAKHAAINVELDEHALNRLNDAVPGALLAMWPLVQQVVQVVQEKQQAESNDEETDEEDSNEESTPNVGRRWIVVGQDDRKVWSRLSRPFEQLEDAEKLLANEHFRRQALHDVSACRVVTMDEWRVCFHPQYAPPGIAAVLSEVSHERPIWMVVQWLPDGYQVPRTFRWVPRAISYNLESMIVEQLQIGKVSPSTAITAVCSYPNWLHAFRERDTVYLPQEPFPSSTGEADAIWDAMRCKWTLLPGQASVYTAEGAQTDENGRVLSVPNNQTLKRRVVEESWRCIYHHGFACPPNVREADE